FYFYLTGKKGKNVSLNYLTKLHQFSPDSHGEPGFWDGYRHFLAFAVNTMDRIWLWNKEGAGFKFEIDGHEEIKKYVDEKKGALFLGAHVGSFDALRVLSKNLDVKVNVVGYADNARKFETIQKRVNPDSHVTFFNLEDGSVHGVLKLQEMLENGEIVAMMGDRFVPGARQRVSTVSFLGSDAPFPENPWIVAHLLGCPVFFVSGLRHTEKKYTCIARLIDEKIVLERQNRSLEIRKYSEQYARFLENICKEFPYQWFNFYDFWKLDKK
ncbi:MAG: hypothetical protein JXR91_17870, partial [Deltaproteobacteria bacterium]|nr:hypothetical protein [Deltaproteobacteria bacterium]